MVFFDEDYESENKVVPPVGTKVRFGVNAYDRIRLNKPIIDTQGEVVLEEYGLAWIRDVYGATLSYYDYEYEVEEVND